jgi:hypothetical protein
MVYPGYKLREKQRFKELLTKGDKYGWKAVDKQLKPLRAKLGNDWNISYKWEEIRQEVEALDPEEFGCKDLVPAIPVTFLGGGPNQNIVEGICKKWDAGMIDALKEAVPGKRFVYTAGRHPQDWAEYSTYGVAYKIEEGNLLITFNAKLGKIHGFGAETLEWWLKENF